MTTDPRRLVAVMGVVRDARRRILLVKTERRGWEPPGGQIEQGEGLIEGLQREILEESGCVVDFGRLTGVYSNITAPYLVMFTFLCSHVHGDPAPSAETAEAGWFTQAEARRLVTYPTQAVKLKDALRAREEVVYRVYRNHPFQLISERKV